MTKKKNLISSSLTHLDYRLAANEMGTATNGNASTRPVHNFLDAFDQFRHIAKPRRAIRIGKERIFAANMTEAMSNTAALAAVLGQGHHSQHIIQAVILRKVEHHVDRLVAAAVVDDDDFVTAEALIFQASCASRALSVALLGRRRERVPSASCSSAASKMPVQVLDGLFQCGDYTILLVVRGEDDAEEKFRGFNGANVGRWIRFVWAKTLLAEVSFGEPSVVPAGERARSRLAGRAAGDVCLFRGEDGARLGGDEVEEEEELR